MHPVATAITFEELTTVLVRLNTACTAPELHGVMTGLLSGGARLNRAMLQKVLEAHAEGDSVFGDEVMAQLWQLQLKTMEDLGTSELVFTPLVPEDDDDLGHRVTALSDWCQGFLVGFGTTVRPNDTRVHEESVRETLEDIVHVANVDPTAEDNDEADEFAYAELYEFVRMAAIHLFEEMSPPEERHLHSEDASGAPTLH